MKRRFLLSEAEAMVGYVRRILADVVSATAKERECLAAMAAHDGRRFESDYALRRLYLDAVEGLAVARRDRDAAEAEFKPLGVLLVDDEDGAVAFPFHWSRNARSRKRRRAHFLHFLRDDPERGIQHWRFADEYEIRRVPAHWLGQMKSPILAEVGR
jgi:hypothetical protein